MKKLASLSLVALLLVMTTLTLSGRPGRVGQDRDGNDDIPGRFVGAWQLARLEQPGADGTIHNADFAGLLVFTRDGHMSVQVMERNSQAASPAGPEQYSQGGYEASFGTYEIDESSHAFTFHVEGALVRSLIGKDLRRAFELSGKHLVVRSTRPEERWRAVWEHY